MVQDVGMLYSPRVTSREVIIIQLSPNSYLGDTCFITPNVYFAQVTMILQLEQMQLLCPILYSVHVFYVCFSQVLFLLFFFYWGGGGGGGGGDIKE